MAIEESSTFTSESSVNDTSHNESVNVSLDESEPADDVTGVQKSRKGAGEKWAQRQKKATRYLGKYDSRLAEFFYGNVGKEYGTGQRKI